MDSILIMGAAVRPDGSPSGALLRRLIAAHEAYDASRRVILVSGGVGEAGIAESAVMKSELVKRGVPPDDVVEDDLSRDTLESVVWAAGEMRRRGFRDVGIATDRYHVARCRVLLRILGIRAVGVVIDSGLGPSGWRRWALMYLREAVALPYDVLLLLCRRHSIAHRDV